MEVEKSFRKHFKPICTNKSNSFPSAPFMDVHSNESGCVKLTQFPCNRMRRFVCSLHSIQRLFAPYHCLHMHAHTKQTYSFFGKHTRCSLSRMQSPNKMLVCKSFPINLFCSASFPCRNLCAEKVKRLKYR